MARSRVQAGDTADAQGQYHRNDNDDSNGEEENGEYLMHSYWIDVIESCTYKEKREETERLPWRNGKKSVVLMRIVAAFWFIALLHFVSQSSNIPHRDD